MKLNQNTELVSEAITMVPYKKIHVQRYHSWMEDSELREMTGSEELTLEQEYKMQKDWLNDEDKCTFIVLDAYILKDTDDEVESMIGDVNLFLTKEDDNILVAECNAMIAEKAHRCQGKGFRAIVMMLRYGVEYLKVNKYVAKIKTDNQKSIDLFSRIGFIKDSESVVFQEVTLIRNVDEEWKSFLCPLTDPFVVCADGVFTIHGIQSVHPFNLFNV